MIIFVLTKSGFAEMELIAKCGNAIVWVNQGVLSEKEINTHREQDMNITNFTSFVNPENEVEVNRAIETISEHHQNEIIWVERATSTK